MIRTILKSDKNNLILNLPDELVGKMIEVIAFSIEEDNTILNSASSKETRIKELAIKLKPFTFNSGGYKFDRDEANDYE
ncbi:hypothetical protein [Mucilaginibacter flavus]|uniref:hypothetical protein n=1 Tax=Mucilaginibacter flavus TaxID=931504 RepID=UPI0025B488BE|nr:hypothetical protein [Mucilaginibacter flavus]MDN3583113.1 hypothetical protein [Mucilaginibacter flavus]